MSNSDIAIRRLQSQQLVHTVQKARRSHSMVWRCSGSGLSWAKWAVGGTCKKALKLILNRHSLIKELSGHG